MNHLSQFAMQITMAARWVLFLSKRHPFIYCWVMRKNPLARIYYICTDRQTHFVSECKEVNPAGGTVAPVHQQVTTSTANWWRVIPRREFQRHQVVQRWLDASSQLRLQWRIIHLLTCTQHRCDNYRCSPSDSVKMMSHCTELLNIYGNIPVPEILM